MTDQTFAQIQVIELTRLLEEVGDDPVLGPQFRDRLKEAETFLKQAVESTSPRELKNRASALVADRS